MKELNIFNSRRGISITVLSIVSCPSFEPPAHPFLSQRGRLYRYRAPFPAHTSPPPRRDDVVAPPLVTPTLTPCRCSAVRSPHRRRVPNGQGSPDETPLKSLLFPIYNSFLQVHAFLPV